MDYNPESELEKAAENIAELNPEQKLVPDEILASVLRTDVQGRPQGKISLSMVQEDVESLLLGTPLPHLAEVTVSLCFVWPLLLDILILNCD